MQIQVKVNETGVLRNQRHAFTNRFTLLSELMQNARRAGASRIDVHYDHGKQVLRVCDNGRGIEDFQKLLTFHESGWGEDLAAQEHPFGIGFSKCLYAASRCIVASGRQLVDIDTAVALNRFPIDVQDIPMGVAGTQIELHRVDLAGIGSEIEWLCMGFPVEIFFNGQVIPRPYALANLEATPTPVGAVYLCGTHDGRCSAQNLIFLQGFCVKQPIFIDAERVNVVHLDARQFMARLPDRDQLIDEDQQLRKVDGQIKSSWRQILEAAKTQMPPEQFVSTYYPAMRQVGLLALINDLDVLPQQLCERIVGYPIQTEISEQRFLEEVEHAPSRQAVEAGEVTLVSIESITENNAAHWMLAWRKGWLVFRSHGLDTEHWVHAYVKDLSECKAMVEAVDVEVQTTMFGRWVWPDVVLCASVRISIGNDTVEIKDAGVCHEETLYIPLNETSGKPVRQLSNFIDENDAFCHDLMDEDTEGLATLIRRLRCVNPVDTLNSLLQDAALGKYPSLHGKCFEVSIELPSQEEQAHLATGQAARPAHRIRLVTAQESGAVQEAGDNEVLEVRHAGS